MIQWSIAKDVRLHVPPPFERRGHEPEGKRVFRLLVIAPTTHELGTPGGLVGFTALFVASNRFSFREAKPMRVLQSPIPAAVGLRNIIGYDHHGVLLPPPWVAAHVYCRAAIKSP